MTMLAAHLDMTGSAKARTITTTAGVLPAIKESTMPMPQTRHHARHRRDRDFVMLNALAGTNAARDAVAQATQSLKIALIR